MSIRIIDGGGSSLVVAEQSPAAAQTKNVTSAKLREAVTRSSYFSYGFFHKEISEKCEEHSRSTPTKTLNGAGSGL